MEGDQVGGFSVIQARNDGGPNEGVGKGDVQELE